MKPETLSTILGFAMQDIIKIDDELAELISRIKNIEDTLENESEKDAKSTIDNLNTAQDLLHKIKATLGISEINASIETVASTLQQASVSYIIS